VNDFALSQAPLIVGFAVLMFLASFRHSRKENASASIALVALGLTAWLMWVKLPPGAEYFGGAIRVTLAGKLLAWLCLAFTAMAMLLSEGYLEKVRIHPADWRMVVLAMGLGMTSLCLAGDLATLFVAYELVSIPSYVLAGFNHRDPRSNEAGMKYLLLGVFTSVLFLLGISFLYGATGEIDLIAIRDSLLRAAENGAVADLTLAKLSLAFILGALLFKVGAAPFHAWIPDVYQGSNMASLGIISSPVKVAVFGMMAMLLWGPYLALAEIWKPALLIAALASAVLGNLQAMLQTNLKRLIAYSAVVNAGFILLCIFLDSVPATVFYLGVYGITTLGAWAALMAMGTRNADVDEIADLAGMGKRRKWLALGFTVILLSYAGIPPTAGFAAKFGMALEALKPEAALPRTALFVVSVSVIAGLVSFYYYFQIVRAMWLQAPPRNAGEVGCPGQGWNYALALVLSLAGIIALGLLMRLPG